MKQTCVIIILAYFTWFQRKPAENVAETLNTPFLTRDFTKQNGVSVKLSNVITSSQRHKYARIIFANESVGEMISHGRNSRDA